MASAAGDPDSTTLSPDEAYAALGNETRMAILQTLGETQKPLSFSELRDTVGVSDSGQFNYHLGKLEGHFVRKGEHGYGLRQSGRRVVEAVLSGAVTEVVELEPTRLEAPCPYCGADIEISYREERLLVRCTDCAGTVAGIPSSSEAFPTLPRGTVTLYYLPSAGFQGRTLHEMLNALIVWTHSEHVAMGNDICPRCSGDSELDYAVCEDHEGDPEVCDRCGLRFPILVDWQCTKCHHSRKHVLRARLRGNPTVRGFYESRGFDTMTPDWEEYGVFYDHTEEILETDPLRAKISFPLDDEQLDLTLDESLNVIDSIVRSSG